MKVGCVVKIRTIRFYMLPAGAHLVDPGAQENTPWSITSDGINPVNVPVRFHERLLALIFSSRKTKNHDEDKTLQLECFRLHPKSHLCKPARLFHSPLCPVIWQRRISRASRDIRSRMASVVDRQMPFPGRGVRRLPAPKAFSLTKAKLPLKKSEMHLTDLPILFFLSICLELI